MVELHAVLGNIPDIITMDTLVNMDPNYVSLQEKKWLIFYLIMEELPSINDIWVVFSFPSLEKLRKVWDIFDAIDYLSWVWVGTC